MKLLIVEDNPEIRRVMKRMLAGLAAEIAECSDGAEALAAYIAQRPDYVLMDIEMKTMDGIAATRQIITRRSGGTDHHRHQLQPRRIARRSACRRCLRLCAQREPTRSTEPVTNPMTRMERIKTMTRHITIILLSLCLLLSCALWSLGHGGESRTRHARADDGDDHRDQHQ